MASRKRSAPKHLSVVPSIQDRVEVFLKGAGDMRLESDVRGILASFQHDMAGPWPDESELRSLALRDLSDAVLRFGTRLWRRDAVSAADMRLVSDRDRGLLAKRLDASISADSADVRSEERGALLSSWCSSDASYAMLDRTSSAGSTWMAGGCSLLAHALRKNYPDAKLVGIEVDGTLEHVGALIDGVVFDAIGAHDPEDWAVAWTEYEQRDEDLNSLRVVDLGDGSGLPPDLRVKRKDVALIASALKPKLGNPTMKDFDFFTADDVFGEGSVGQGERQVSDSRLVFRSVSRGDIVSVGKSKWVILRPLGDLQAMAYKHPSKHRDVFEIFADSWDDDEVVVTKIDASSNRVGEPVARGPLRSTGERLEMDGFVAPVTSTPSGSHARGRSRRKNPDVLYHVTTFSAVEDIAASGLKPRRGGGVYSHGGYGEHSQGKVFLAEGGAAALSWYGKIQDMLWHEHSDDEEPDHLVPVMLRVDLSSTSLQEEVDPVGDRDVPGSYFVTDVVPPDAIEFFDPTTQEWTPLEEWNGDVYDGVESIEYFDEDGDVVDEDDTDEYGEQAWSTRSFIVFGPYEDGGFKPSSQDEDAW